MATIKEWQGEVNRLSPLEADRKASAILELMTWPIFATEFKDMGLTILFRQLQVRSEEKGE